MKVCPRKQEAANRAWNVIPDIKPYADFVNTQGPLQHLQAQPRKICQKLLDLLSSLHALILIVWTGLFNLVWTEMRLKIHQGLIQVVIKREQNEQQVSLDSIKVRLRESERNFWTQIGPNT